MEVIRKTERELLNSLFLEEHVSTCDGWGSLPLGWPWHFAREDDDTLSSDFPSRFLSPCPPPFPPQDEDLLQPMADEHAAVNGTVAPGMTATLVLHTPSALQLAVATHKVALVEAMLRRIAALRAGSGGGGGAGGSGALGSGAQWLDEHTLTVSGRYHLTAIPPLVLAVLCSAPEAMLRALVRTGGHAPAATDRMERRVDALIAAAETGQLGLVSELVSLGAPLDLAARTHVLSDMHPVHVAAVAKHLHVVRWLVREAGVSVDVRAGAGAGDTLMHVAAQRGYADLARMLGDELGADFAAENRMDGQTPYSLARQYRREDVAAYLEGLYARAGRPLPAEPTAAQMAVDSRNAAHNSEVIAQREARVRRAQAKAAEQEAAAAAGAARGEAHGQGQGQHKDKDEL